MNIWSTFGIFFETQLFLFDFFKSFKKMFYVKPFENRYFIYKTLTLIHKCGVLWYMLPEWRCSLVVFDTTLGLGTFNWFYWQASCCAGIAVFAVVYVALPGPRAKAVAAKRD